MQGALLKARVGSEVRYARSDALGEFSLELPSGVYRIEIEHPQFASIDGGELSIEAGARQAAQFKLDRPGVQSTAQSNTIESVTVVGSYIRGSADQERRASNVIDVLSAEDFRVTGDSDAVTALGRVTGLTIVNDKFIYVRGLGERYSNTTFNGAALPSPDPIRRVVPLDLFPTGALDSVDIQKTYTPDLPGDFSGGTVQLTTRQASDERLLRLAFNVESNGQTTGREALTYDGGDRDYLGYDDGTRDLPGTITGLTTGSVPLASRTPAEIQSAGLSFDRRNQVELEDNLPANFGFEAGYGDRFDNGLGFLIGAKYDNDWAFRAEERRTSAGDGMGGVILRDDQRQARTVNNVEFSTLANLEWRLAPDQFLRGSSFITRSTDKRTIRTIGRLDENDIFVADTELEFEERQLLTQQLSGEHLIAALGDLGIKWQATYAEAERDKPDRQFLRYERSGFAADGSAIFQFSQSGQSNERSFEELDDESQSGGVDFSLPLQLGAMETTLKWGANYVDRERDSSFRRFRFQTDFSRNNLEDVLGFAPDVVFRDENIGPGLFELREVTQPTDNYTAEESNVAFYLTADMRIGERLQLSLGARREDSEIETTTFDRSDPTQQVVADLEDDDILPAVNATYALTDSIQLRAGYSKTLNRPDLRELSPAPFIEPEERFVILGNPNLKTAEIDNYDLRFEWYWSSLDNLQVALFYKDFKDPIESFVQFGGSNGGARSFQNALSAENQGIEVQVRTGLGRFGSALTDFFVKLNGAYIDSEVDVPDNAQQTTKDRELEGQSPYVINFQLGYDNPVRRIESALLFNVADDRINAVGVRGLPDAIEESAPRLDFNYRQVVSLFGSEWTVKFRALNLLDPDYEIKRGSITERGYKLGRTVQIGLDYQF